MVIRVEFNIPQKQTAARLRGEKQICDVDGIQEPENHLSNLHRSLRDRLTVFPSALPPTALFENPHSLLAYSIRHHVAQTTVAHSLALAQHRQTHTLVGLGQVLGIPQGLLN